MSASEARKLARTALGMAPAGGIREELRADLEAAEAEFARRLKAGEDFDTLMNEAEMDRKKAGGGGKKRAAPPKKSKSHTSDPIVEEPLSAGEGAQALQLVPHSVASSASLVPVMVQQLLAREQVALEQQKDALEQERVKRQREQDQHELEMANKRLELAATAKDKGLVDQLPLIFGGSKLVQQQEPAVQRQAAGGSGQQEKHPPSAAAEKQQPPASPAKSGKGKGAAAAAKEAAGESNTPKLRSGDAANKA